MKTSSISRAVIVLSLLVLPLLTGCGGGGGGNGSGTGTGGTTGPPPPTLMLSTLTGTGLTATLAEDNATISAGGTVAYTLTLTNSSSAPITVNAMLNGAALFPDASLQIVNSAGTIVYPTKQPLVTPPPPPLDNTQILQPGQSFSKSLSLAVFDTADIFRATATFQIVQSPATTTQTVLVGPLQVTAQ